MKIEVGNKYWKRDRSGWWKIIHKIEGHGETHFIGIDEDDNIDFLMGDGSYRWFTGIVEKDDAVEEYIETSNKKESNLMVHRNHFQTESLLKAIKYIEEHLINYPKDADELLSCINSFLKNYHEAVRKDNDNKLLNTLLICISFIQQFKNEKTYKKLEEQFILNVYMRVAFFNYPDGTSREGSICEKDFYDEFKRIFLKAKESGKLDLNFYEWVLPGCTEWLKKMELLEGGQLNDC